MVNTFFQGGEKFVGGLTPLVAGLITSVKNKIQF